MDAAVSRYILSQLEGHRPHPSENRLLPKMVATYSNCGGAGGYRLQAPVVLGEQT
ncbi:hypothetical protein hamaS1_31820 [Moorella sp. Hama-1]|nr:hypothetical protein hamaS1_31820 [Moorella sp. Hama-1]